MKIRYLRKNNYFKYNSLAYYLDEYRKITRLLNGQFITGLFNPNEIVFKITHEEAIDITLTRRKI